MRKNLEEVVIENESQPYVGALCLVMADIALP